MLRHDQLAIRLVEMRATLDVMNRVCQGKLGENTNRLKASRTVDWEQWRLVVECGDGKVVFAGHSFGGTAAVSTRGPWSNHPWQLRRASLHLFGHRSPDLHFHVHVFASLLSSP
jgi:hypothetical protein